MAHTGLIEKSPFLLAIALRTLHTLQGSGIEGTDTAPIAGKHQYLRAINTLGLTWACMAFEGLLMISLL
jgi:hypothetical protein